MRLIVTCADVGCATITRGVSDRSGMQRKDDSTGIVSSETDSTDSSVHGLQKEAAFYRELQRSLAEANSIPDLLQLTGQVIGRILEPAFLFIAVSGQDESSGLWVYSNGAIQETHSVSEFLRNLVSTGWDSISSGLAESLPGLHGLQIHLAKSSKRDVRSLLLLAGIPDLSSEQRRTLTQSAVSMIQMGAEYLKAQNHLRDHAVFLKGLHSTAASMNQRIFQLDELLQDTCKQAREILSASGVAVLAPRDEMKTSYIVQAKDGFESGQIPLSNALFAKFFEDLEIHGGNSVVYRPSRKETLLLVPLIRRREASGVLFFSGQEPDFDLTPARVQTAEILGFRVSLAIENKVLVQRFADSQTEWENTFDSIADPIYIIDTDFRLMKINKSLASIAGKNLKMPLDRNCYRYLFGQNSICSWCPVPQNITDPVSVDAPFFAAGQWQLQSFPYLDKADHRIGSIHIMRDVTLLKRMQEQLIEHEKLASIGKLISGVAHEVRNPLFGISATARALSNELADLPKMKPYLDIISSETLRLNRLMEDLLDYARPVKIDKNPLDLREIVQEAIEYLKQLPATSQAAIHLVDSDRIPAMNLDRNKIKQVLLNLLENGIQHSKENPRVDVFVEYLSLASPPQVILVIKDNGTGITPENLPRIFDPFFTTRQRGTGLGLSIVRKVIHDHGGRLAVESHVGVGTTFRISLPVPPVQS